GREVEAEPGGRGLGDREVLEGFACQAEDGIPDFHVSGVQTCALPILPTGTAMTRAITVATMTRASVTIESSHNSMQSRKANPKKVRTPAKVPRSQNAITAKMPQRISGCGAWRTALTPS